MDLQNQTIKKDTDTSSELCVHDLTVERSNISNLDGTMINKDHKRFQDQHTNKGESVKENNLMHIHETSTSDRLAADDQQYVQAPGTYQTPAITDQTAVPKHQILPTRFRTNDPTLEEATPNIHISPDTACSKETADQLKKFKDLKRIMSDFTRWQRSQFRLLRSTSSKSLQKKKSHVLDKSTLNVKGSRQKWSKRRFDLAKMQDEQKHNLNDYGQVFNMMDETKTYKRAGMTVSPPLTHVTSYRLIGEVVFQLERRIMAYIFKGERVKLEYTILNANQMIDMYHKSTESQLLNRKDKIFSHLRRCGLRAHRHNKLMMGLMEAYGTCDNLQEAKQIAKDNGKRYIGWMRLQRSQLPGGYKGYRVYKCVGKYDEVVRGANL
ncbi:hypothetical protein BSL78_29771 [Apostichopus japonicus]|uniref:Speriolin C-terminal domain-containing protein n=1 Tax=Stichopus japonicus TaxID=307972 RepID=A0A2G8JCE8_STIJA|nr:hypothetical protein BSL78_29771 [Apostichopus japonicus]